EVRERGVVRLEGFDPLPGPARHGRHRRVAGGPGAALGAACGGAPAAGAAGSGVGSPGPGGVCAFGSTVHGTTVRRPDWLGAGHGGGVASGGTATPRPFSPSGCSTNHLHVVAGGKSH